VRAGDRGRVKKAKINVYVLEIGYQGVRHACYEDGSPASSVRHACCEGGSPAPGVRYACYEDGSPASGVRHTCYESGSPASGVRHACCEGGSPASGVRHACYEDGSPASGVRHHYPDTEQAPLVYKRGSVKTGSAAPSFGQQPIAKSLNRLCLFKHASRVR
jgi:hypothetical protein